MHLLPLTQGALDADPAAVDLGQTPADLLVLSFSDGELAALADVARGMEGLPGLRLAALKALAHPFSVDLYVEKVAARAKLVVVRALGGLDYWRYGLEELGAAARRHDFQLAAVPGCDQADPRLDALSTWPADDLRRLWRYFREGGPGNLRQALLFVAARIGHGAAWREPEALPAGAAVPSLGRAGAPDAPHALLTFYRSALQAGDVAPVAALADALAARGARVTAFAASSLKDEEAAALLAEAVAADPPDVVLNTTAFSARRGTGAAPLDGADCPVLQVIQAGSARDAWAASGRGLGAVDLAMNVVLPEVDGRIVATAVSFKGAGAVDAVREFSPVLHRPDPEGVARAADLAMAWARLRRAPRAGRRLALVLSDYPGKAGRGGYAVGLDAPASLAGIASLLAGAGYAVDPVDDPARLMADLTEGDPEPVLSLDSYARAFAALPAAFRDAVAARWGEPAADRDAASGAFAFRLRRAGALVCAVQPDRGDAASRRADYHDAAHPPRHGYVAFYIWLREVERVHALVHLGTHGTLEWLPGKAVALSAGCAPSAVLGPVPLVYPFIVSDPGEAAQAKRRAAAVTVGHMTPPLVEAGLHGEGAEIEALFDEYAEALSLDPRRARLLGSAILDRARCGGLLADCGVPVDAAPEEALGRLDSWLCDVKEARIGDGLHVFGAGPCGAAERNGLLRALDGGFVPPGPSGSPAAGRADVLPTGRNLFTTDPRAVPTRTAYEIGARAAAEFATRYAQDHGDWPRRLVMDLWGSATMRTGGDDLAQALALMGVRPRWHGGSTRVDGFEILPEARLERPRVDVTLRISGLFRDTFPDQIALFDAAVRAVAALDEGEDWNPLAAERRAGQALDRVFGGAPDVYGLGLARAVSAGAFAGRAELGERYLAAASHAYAGPEAAPRPSSGFRDRVRGADGYLHVADLPEVDVLTSDTYPEHEGGFAAAAAAVGAAPALYHADATRPGRFVVRTLSEEVARAVRARAANPRWIAGQMRHGHRGAAEIAETVDALFCFAATSDAAPSRHFDLLFEATLGDDAVRDFMLHSNPPAARAAAARFDEARERGYWHPRRNSTAAVLAEARAAA